MSLYKRMIIRFGQEWSRTKGFSVYRLCVPSMLRLNMGSYHTTPQLNFDYLMYMTVCMIPIVSFVLKNSQFVDSSIKCFVFWQRFCASYLTLKTYYVCFAGHLPGNRFSRTKNMIQWSLECSYGIMVFLLQW